jgi:hypothetical protein
VPTPHLAGFTQGSDRGAQGTFSTGLYTLFSPNGNRQTIVRMDATDGGNPIVVADTDNVDGDGISHVDFTEVNGIEYLVGMRGTSTGFRMFRISDQTYAVKGRSPAPTRSTRVAARTGTVSRPMERREAARAACATRSGRGRAAAAGIRGRSWVCGSGRGIATNSASSPITAACEAVTTMSAILSRALTVDMWHSRATGMSPAWRAMVTCIPTSR